ncbi:WD repeat, SAM and U-box domain-containing protein 1 isoform X2 [Latimeria chalumnae]
MFVTGSTCGDLTVWDFQMKCLFNKKTAHDLGVACCEFSPQPVLDGGNHSDFFQLASCGQDNKIKFWVVSYEEFSGCTFKFKCTLNDHRAPVLSCAFSPDGQILVSGSVDKSVIIYKANNGTVLHTLTQHTRYVTACALAPNLPIIATGSMDKTVNIWQMEQKTAFYGGMLTDRSKPSVQSWSEEEVSAWLITEELSELTDVFKTNNIDGKELLGLTKETLTNELKIASLGLRNKVLRKIEELRVQESATDNIPDEFLCPITRELMKDPVIASDGYSYERTAIENWINTKKRSSPMTNVPLQSSLLTPNRTLKMAIDRWVESQQTKLN